MAAKLTPTQAKALECIKTSIERSGVAPTLRELCAYMGYSAIGSAQDIVLALRKKGFLVETQKQTARAFVLTAKGRQECFGEETAASDEHTLAIPCLGSVPAGNPLLAVEEHVGTLRMSMAQLAKSHLKANELFAVRAIGESMVGAGILDGDWLVVRHQNEAPVESIVVARCDGDVTVKRLMRSHEHGWFLKPENMAFKELYAKDSPFEIVGRVVALQRSFL